MEALAMVSLGDRYITQFCKIRWFSTQGQLGAGEDKVYRAQAL